MIKPGFVAALCACTLALSPLAFAQPAASSLYTDIATLDAGRAVSDSDPHAVAAAQHVRAVAAAYGLSEAEAAQPVVTATSVLRKAVPAARVFELFDAATRIGAVRKTKGREALVNALTSYIGARRAPNTSHERAVELVLRPGQAT